MSSHGRKTGRPYVQGKFIFVESEKLFIRGVTYGPFRPRGDGGEYPAPEVVERDFAQMAELGVNAVRTYTTPPVWLLDMAWRHGLRVMVGLPWEQHVTFLDDASRVESIIQRTREVIRRFAGHPAILCYTIGNEIPAPIVRWHGRRRVERFLARLYRAVKAEDPDALATYVNYPTTEYLQLPFLDFVSFNVYLEEREKLEAYLARLQNLAGNRPLVMAEIGLDSRRNGEETQAEVLKWQIQSVYALGCVGLFVFAWTDEWHRGGYDIEDWDFGLTRRDRSPKPALVAVREAFRDAPFPADLHWPRVSVVVCTYNGSRTIRDTLEGLQRLDYPDYEVIVVNDGSVDATAETAREFGVRLITTENNGLAHARNVGMKAATGEIVAYIDDDARPDPHWLTYLAAVFLSSDHAGVGGPNIPPPGDGRIADCIANAPGGPVHVLRSDREAEHIPGCNMAFWKSSLEALGGFDPRFRTAGDDVDLCWQLQERGWTLGFSPAAVVWHHRRNSVKTYWKQQVGYGRAEALLEMKWPEKYNSVGHITWQGRLYGSGLARAFMFRRWRVYHGVWGSGLFQSIYEAAPGGLSSLPLMPEWYLNIAGLAALSLLGLLWKPLLLALPLLVVVLGVTVAQAVLSASQASYSTPPTSFVDSLRLRTLTILLHLVQPLARLRGRLRHGLTPWRRRGMSAFRFPWPRSHSSWSEQWRALEETLSEMEKGLRQHGSIVRRGGDYDRWDLEIRGGLFGGVRLRAAVEEHGGGRQLLRVRSWPRLSPPVMIAVAGLSLLAAAAMFDGAELVATLLGLAVLLLSLRALGDCGAATAGLTCVLGGVEPYCRFDTAGSRSRARITGWVRYLVRR